MSEELHQLVRDMSKGEKRFFTLLHSHYDQDEPTNTLQLLTAIDSLEEWDESKLRKKHAGKSFLKFLPAEKQRLRQEIYDTLVIYQRNGPITFRIRNMLSQAEILFDMKQLEQGKKLLQKAKSMAEEACIYELKLEAGRILHNKSVGMHNMSLVREICEERRLLMQQIQEEDEYSLLTIRLMELGPNLRRLHADQQISGDIAKLLEDPMLGPDVKHLSPLGEIGYHGFWAQYCYIRDLHEKRRYHGEKIFDAFAGRPLLVEGRLPQFIAASSNTLQDAYSAGHTGRLQYIGASLGTLMRSLKRSSKDARFHLESLQLVANIYASLLTGNFAAIVAQEKNVMRIIQQLAQAKVIRSFNIAYLFAKALFASGNYRKVIRLLSTINAFPELIRFEDRDLMRRYMILMCHFALGNSDTVEQQIISIRRHARRSGETFQGEELLLEFFRESTKLDGAKLKKRIRQLLDAWIPLQEEPLEKTFANFVYFIPIWLKSQVNGRGYTAEWNTFITETRGNISPAKQ
jgi:hypothetical protein